MGNSAGFWATALVVFVASGAGLAASQGDRSLTEVVKRRDQAAFEALIKLRVDVNAVEVDGSTPLHEAADWGNPKVVEMLIRAGAKVNIANRYGVKPLSIAAAKGNAAVVELLLNASADPNTALKEGETALMSAARAGSVAAIDLLVRRGAALNAKEEWRGQTAIMWAAVENHVDAVKALLAAGADINTASKGGYTALLFAVRAGHLEMIKTLLDGGANANDALPDGTSALVVAAMNAHWEAGSILLERGAGPNADQQGWAALHQVAITRSPHHANVHPQPIPTGAIDSLDFVRALIARGADVNLRTKHGNIDRFRQWINREGATAFFLAAKAVDVPMMKLLLEKGADPKIPTKTNLTPLAAAAGVGYCQGESPGTDAEALEAVRLLQDLGLDVNAADEDGFTPMHGAGARGVNSIVRLLYDHGGKLDAKTKQDQWTPWNMANGVFVGNTYTLQVHTAAYIRSLMNGSRVQ